MSTSLLSNYHICILHVEHQNFVEISRKQTSGVITDLVSSFLICPPVPHVYNRILKVLGFHRWELASISVICYC